MLFTILAEEWKMHTARPLFFVSRNSTKRILRMVKYMSEESGILLTTSRKRQRNTHKIKIVEEYDYEVA